MKKFSFFALAIAAATTFLSCSRDKDTSPSYVGDTQMLDCFNRIGIKTIKDNNPDSLIIIIPDNLPSKFNVEGKRLQFTATLRSNTLTPTFPDPSIDPGTIYQADVSDVKEVQ